MTMAAGFITHDGIVLCADTLHGDGQTVEHREKIFPWAGKHAAVCFALAGNSDVARVAVDRCIDALAGARDRSLTLRRVRALLEKPIRDSYRVTAPPGVDIESFWFELLVAIDTASDAPALLVARPYLTTVDRFDCIGVGRTFARHLVEQVYQRDMSINEICVLAIQVLAQVKERVPGVGGPSQFISLVNKRLSAVVPHDVDSSEPRVLEYQRRVNAFFMAAVNADLPEARFEDEVARFAHFAREMRRGWMSDGSPWRSLRELLTTPSAEPQGLMRKADSPILQRSTRGRTRRPPSRA